LALTNKENELLSTVQINRLRLRKSHQIGQRCVFAHDEADFGSCDKLLPMAISDRRVLEFTHGSQ
jgi:hypothetical protein